MAFDQKKTADQFRLAEIKLVIERLGFNASPRQLIDATLTTCGLQGNQPFDQKKLVTWMEDTPLLR